MVIRFDYFPRWLLVAGLCRLLTGGLPVALGAPEVTLEAAEFQKLDTFEGVVLGKADKVFAAKDYRRAVAEYEAFILQYPRSGATAYALLRKGRSLHLDNKRFEAIKAYNEVLDYFPNALPYASAALYYIGAAHWESGEVGAAMTAWTEMAQDKDYRQDILAAAALNALAGQLVKEGQADQAVKYYAQVAVDFRRRHEEEARAAIEQVRYHYVRRSPDQPALRKFYDAVGTFEHRPAEPSDGNYWTRVRDDLRRWGGQWPSGQEAQRKTFFAYWVGQMEGRHATWDDFQIDRIGFQREVDGNEAQWMERLDRQFDQYQKPGDYARIVKWIGLYLPHPAKVDAYYQKLDFAKMTNDAIRDLGLTLHGNVALRSQAYAVFDKLRWTELDESYKANLLNQVWHRGDARLIELVCERWADREAARWKLVQWYHWHRLVDKGLETVEPLTQVPDYASNAQYHKGDFLQWKQQWPDAIKAYQAADNPPRNLWGMVQCYRALKQPDRALALLQEIENFFKDEAPRAALVMAHVHKEAGRQAQYIVGLRNVLKKYPKSGPSSEAHQELERLGVRIGGGVDAE